MPAFFSRNGAKLCPEYTQLRNIETGYAAVLPIVQICGFRIQHTILIENLNFNELNNLAIIMSRLR